MLVVLFALISVVAASDVGATFGDGAISQVLRHAAAKALEEPRVIDLLIQTREKPGLPPLALFDVFQSVDYQNLSVHFHRDAIHLIVDGLSLDSRTHISEIFWPLGIGDKIVNVSLQMDRGEMHVDIDESTLSLKNCHVLNPSLDTAVQDHWFADKSTAVLASLIEPALESTICSGLMRYIRNVHHRKITQLPVHEIIPEKARKYLAAQNATAFYKLKTIRVEEQQLTILARVEWAQITDTNEFLPLSNSSVLDVELRGHDFVTFWLEDSILNNLLEQVDWNFEWMNEKIPINSEIIPPDSREFLTTLCTECYFQVNVAARGQPTIMATNSSLVLEKRDRVHLQVVNPNKNAASVFVSFTLTVQAEVRPSFDNGTLRTLVQLLDTNITMEEKPGAFPKNWGIFMQDLMRGNENKTELGKKRGIGMILDMLWPEIKTGIEELTYSKGLTISPACGVDPSHLDLEIGEGNIALSSKLLLESLDPEECVKTLKRSLPNTSKIFGPKKNSHNEEPV